MLNLRRIRGLIFDLDNTLFRYGPRYRDYYALTAATAAINLGLRHDLPDLVAAMRESGAADDDDVARFAATHGLPEKKLVHEFNAVAGRMFADLAREPGYVELLADLPEILARVRLPMAIMTHGPRSWAEPVIDHIGVGRVIGPDLVFPVDHIEINGRRSRAGFQTVAERLGLPMTDIAVVDDVADNFIIPKALGAQSVLVHWGRAARVPPDHVDASFRDARPFLHALIAVAP